MTLTPDELRARAEAAEARVAALTAAVVAECVDDLSVPCDCDEDAVCLAHRVLAAADRPEGSDWNGERLQVLATAVGVARLHLANGDPGKAKNVLDVAAEKTHAIIRDSLIAQGHDADKVDALLGRPADRPEGTPVVCCCPAGSYNPGNVHEDYCDLSGTPRFAAWLIERNVPGRDKPPFEWVAREWPKGPTPWTTDAWAARRFPTQDVAEKHMRKHGVLYGVAVEHVFLREGTTP